MTIKAFAASAVTALTDPRARAQALAEAVLGKVRYKIGHQRCAGQAAVAFKSGEGVCQDHAHVFIASARAVGMPARYVSGYLFTGDCQRRRQPRLGGRVAGRRDRLAEHRCHAQASRGAHLLPPGGRPRLPGCGAGARAFAKAAAARKWKPTCWWRSRHCNSSKGPLFIPDATADAACPALACCTLGLRDDTGPGLRLSLKF